MARGKSAAAAVLEAVVDQEADKSEDVVLTEDERQAAADMAMVDDANPRAAYAILHRVDRRTGKRLWLGKVDLSFLEPDIIAEECGGGKFYAAIYRPKGNGKGGHEFSGSKTIEIDDQIPPRVPSWHLKPRPDGVSSSNGVAPHAPERTPSMFETMALQMMTQQMQAQQTAAQQQASTQAAALSMQQQQMQAAAEASRQQMQMQLEMMRQQGEASRAASEQQSRMMQAFMESMRASISSAPKLSDTFGPFIPIALEMLKARKDPMEIAAHIAQLMKPSGNDASTVAGALALVEKGLTIGREMSTTGDGGPATWLDVGKEALHALPAAAAALRGNGQPPSAPVATNPPTNGTAPVANLPPQPPLPLPSPKGVTTPEPQHSPDMMLQATLRPIALELQQRCDANADPDQTADELFERYAAFRGPMLSFTNEPGYQDKLMGLFPQELTGQTPFGASRAPWVRRVMAELAELLREPAE